MPVVLVPAPYRGPTGGQARIETTRDTIRACLEEVESRHPGFGPLVLDPTTGGLHRFVKLFLNGELLGREPSILDTPVAASDEIEVLAAIAGG
ncbi:MAG: MoaD/ThiS family protein [Spirochaetaceae bacterium]|nr:MoaD/ThiS family protein [Myxococcales bacterium]MCB9723143.1 MoaD/ThiS family protein [Spirochaetaceae bacterium]HPG26617.1 MoaD/ThiS family protein [Myxococcota bacterium]